MSTRTPSDGIPSAFKPVDNIEDYSIIEGGEENDLQQIQQDDHHQEKRLKERQRIRERIERHDDGIDKNLKENITKLNINKTEKANVNTIVTNTTDQPISSPKPLKIVKKNKKKWPEELKNLAVEKALTLGITHAIDLLCAEDPTTFSTLSPSTLQYWVTKRSKQSEKKDQK